ncbi:hypothetical protein [Mycolicibacterium insubricum]|uniref:hypothetical protein n=1 Tax=Mycolicibacterium insubricum TaxID=444597 RepID=UPI0021F2F559|nr:hypothetical protein [Mycolicibacterium insubricum]MCV7082406.1 hypothetical protein [Mycolicibacterium insubricum]
MERIVIEFSDPAPVRRGFALLVEQADGGQLQVRDLEFLHSIYGGGPARWPPTGSTRC